MPMYSEGAWTSATSGWRWITALAGTSAGRSSVSLPARFKNGKEDFDLVQTGEDTS